MLIKIGMLFPNQECSVYLEVKKIVRHLRKKRIVYKTQQLVLKRETNDYLCFEGIIVIRHLFARCADFAHSVYFILVNNDYLFIYFVYMDQLTIVTFSLL